MVLGRACRTLSCRNARRGTAAPQDRLRHEPHRAPSGQRQGGVDRHADLAGGRERPGRHPRPQGRVRLLRRPDQPLDGAEHLLEAPRRRQGGHGGVRLRHQRDRAGDADHDAAEHDLHEPVWVECEFEVRLRPILPDHAGGPGSCGRLDARLLRHGDGPRSQAADGRPRGRRCRVSRPRSRRRARAGEAHRAEDRRQRLSAQHRRLLADHPRGRRPTPT